MTTIGAAPAPLDDRRHHALLLGVVGVGLLYSVWLVAHISGEVFLSGDGGVKALLTKQFALGTFGVHLLLPASPAIEDAWRAGLYPFGPPFVYPSEQGYTVSFPFLFEALSGPFYRLFGFRGLYVIPLGCVWLTWWRFAGSLRRLSVPPWVRTGALAVLIFASPLTLYGAMFWEHTLGVFLCYFAVDFLATYRSRTWSSAAAFAAGIASGASFLVRPEAGLLVFFLCVFGVRARPRGSSALWRFIAGVAVATLLALAINRAVYGYPLGAHSRQIVEVASIAQQVRGGFGRGEQLWKQLLVHCPFVIVILVGLLLRRRVWRSLTSAGPSGLLLPCLVFLVALPFIVPNDGGKQIGPRYVLVVVPALVLLAAVSLARIAARRRTWLMIAGGASLAAGFLWDTVHNGRMLIRDYDARVLPALQFLRRDPNALFATNTTFAAQELEAVIPKKLPLLVRNKEGAALAVAKARERGQHTMVFVTLQGSPKPPNLPDVRVRGRGHMGDWAFYELSLTPILKPNDKPNDKPNE